MALILRIENETSLPDGGPLSVTVTGRRSIDVGRDKHLDWCLPDPTRYISGKHFEIRYREGGYWLHDVSANGTFLYGHDHRMQDPHRLRSGDRFVVGHYIIVASLEGEEPFATDEPAPPPAVNYHELWSVDANVAPPIDRALLKPAKERQVHQDFLDWAADVPDPFQARSRRPQPAAEPPASDMSWAAGPASPPPPPLPPAPTMPTPRRPVWDDPIQNAPPPEPAAAAARVPSGQASATGGPMGAAWGISERAPAPGPSIPADRGPSELPADFVRHLARGAGIPESYISGKTPDELAELLGQVLHLVVRQTMALLSGRMQAKRMARSASHTVIEAVDNNPLKFCPTPEEALRIMFGPATRSYLDIRQAFAQGFEDLTDHQIRTYSAMQHALNALMAGIDPQTIERDVEGGGIAAIVGSRKARLWDAFVERWRTTISGATGNPADTFMLRLSEYYDQAAGKKRP
jgi:type VI secretion system protein ImpI